MKPMTILLYGATGYSGRLIAAELKRKLAEEPARYAVILAGRTKATLEQLAQELDFDYRVFGLAKPATVAHGLRCADVVINAAGPFYAPPGGTQVPIARALIDGALRARCHYVDICGEADQYERLESAGGPASSRRVALVPGAGIWAAASDLLFDRALQDLQDAGQIEDGSEIGAVRIAMSRLQTVSRGSVETVWRAIRRSVIVVRRRKWPRPIIQGDSEEMVQWQVPVGQMERSFDFGSTTAKRPDPRIATAASLVDTLVAARTARRRKVIASSIATYVEAGPVARATYQLGALLAPAIAIPPILSLIRVPIQLLAPGPTATERQAEPHIVLLQIDDRWNSPLLDWRWYVPNVYQFTAQLVVAVAVQTVAAKLKGLRTPGEILAPLNLDLNGTAAGPLRGCKLYKRTGALEAASATLPPRTQAGT